METSETKEKLNGKAKIRGVVSLLITLVGVVAITGVMFAFYDGTQGVGGTTLWGLTTYGDFFQQLYGTSVWLGLGIFALVAASIMCGTEIMQTNEPKEVNYYKWGTMVCLALAGSIAAATPFILLFGLLFTLLLGILFLLIALKIL